MVAQTADSDLLPVPLVRDGTTNEPTAVACSLEPNLASGRLAGWQELIAKATNRQATADGVALTFGHDVALTTEIARLAAAEFECCSFFRFAVTLDAAGVRLDIGAPPEARDIITAVFGSPAC